MESSPKTLLRIPALLVGVLLASCSLDPGSGGLGFEEPPPGIVPPGDDGAEDGEGDTGGGENEQDGTSNAVDDTASEPGTSDDPDGTGGGGGGASDSGSDTGDGGDDTGTGDTTGGNTGTEGGAADQPSSGMYSHCLSVNDCDPGFGCLTNDTATDGFCSILCEPVGDPAGCDPDPGGALEPVCTVAGGGESVCALDCSGGQPCPSGMVCTADSLICM